MTVMMSVSMMGISGSAQALAESGVTDAKGEEAESEEERNKIVHGNRFGAAPPRENLRNGVLPNAVRIPLIPPLP